MRRCRWICAKDEENVMSKRINLMLMAVVFVGAVVSFKIGDATAQDDPPIQQSYCQDTFEVECPCNQGLLFGGTLICIKFIGPGQRLCSPPDENLQPQQTCDPDFVIQFCIGSWKIGTCPYCDGPDAGFPPFAFDRESCG